MEYRALPGNGVMQASQLAALPNTVRQNKISGASRVLPGGTTETLRTGSTVVVQGNFQDFLAEQTAMVVTDRTSGTSSPASHEPMTDQQKKSGVSVAGLHVVQKGETIWQLVREGFQVDPTETTGCNGTSESRAVQARKPLRISVKDSATSDCVQQEVVAGWYGKYHQGRPMANGQRFDMHSATIAHREMPIGTKVELENPVTGEKATAVVADRGPFLPGRDVDLSYSLAKRLSLAKQGVGTLKMRVL
jgi:rare lipoprotein A